MHLSVYLALNSAPELQRVLEWATVAIRESLQLADSSEAALHELAWPLAVEYWKTYITICPAGLAGAALLGGLGGAERAERYKGGVRAALESPEGTERRTERRLIGTRRAAPEVRKMWGYAHLAVRRAFRGLSTATEREMALRLAEQAAAVLPIA